MIGFHFYPISDVHGTGEALFFERLAIAAAHGLRALQLREKRLPAGELYRLALKAKKLLEPFGTLLFVNDRIDVALAVGAEGVHLPVASIDPSAARSLWPRPKLLGCSVHDQSELYRAEKAEADFVTVAPVFPTQGKGPPLGLDGLQRLVARAQTPCFALGGVTADNLSACYQAGAAGVSGISLMWEGPGPEPLMDSIRGLWGSL